jgi:hypothetical protein
LSSLSSTIMTVFAISPEPSMPRQPLRSSQNRPSHSQGADRAKNLVPIPYRNDNLSLNSLINRKK